MIVTIHSHRDPHLSALRAEHRAAGGAALSWLLDDGREVLSLLDGRIAVNYPDGRTLWATQRAGETTKAVLARMEAER